MSPQCSRLTRGLAAILAAASLLFSLCTAFIILAAQPEFRVQFVPDDAFYYLTLARHFAQTGQWTFDGGTSITTGFHPLHAYVLAMIQWLSAPSPETFTRASIGYSYFICFVIIACMAIRTIRTGALTPALLLALFVFSRNVSLNCVSGLEWPWVVLMATCYYLLVAGKPCARWQSGLLFATCIIGTWARSDFALLPCIMAGMWVLYWFCCDRRQPLGPVVFGACGAVAGTLLLMWHTYWISGDVVQSSARMKLLWTQRMYGPSLQPILHVYRTLFGPDSPAATLLVLCLALLVLVGGYHLIRYQSNRGPSAIEKDDSDAPLWLGSLAALVAYGCVYRMGPAGIQNWYTANLIVPTYWLLSRSAQARCAQWWRWIFRAPLVGLVLLQIAQSRHMLAIPEWPHQVSSYRAGCYLRDTVREGRVGSWNAGIIGYYQGGTVINLDGLVNNDVYDFIVKQDLAGYADTHAINYIVDYDNMFDPVFCFRGGYKDPSFRSRLTPAIVFNNNQPDLPETTLFKVARSTSVSTQDQTTSTP